MVLGSSCVLQAKSPTGNSGVKSFDINRDGKINVKDMNVLDKAFNTTYKDKKFNPAADLNSDNVINMQDRMLLMAYFSKNNIPIPTMPSIYIPSSTPVATSTPVPVTVNYDVNRDGIIDAKDMDAIDKSFNTLQGYPNFNPDADLNNDKVINMQDRMLLMAYFSKNNIPIPTMPSIYIPSSTPAATSTPVPVTVNYDVNRDGIIDAKDMEAIDKSFNTLQGDPNFNPAADLNSDKVINMQDRMLLMAYFSENNIPIPTMPSIYIPSSTPVATSTPVPVTVNYDVNRDGIIDAKDMDAIDKSFNTLQGDPNFNPAADLNNDKVINMTDRMLLMAYFSKNNIPIPTMPSIYIPSSTPVATSTPVPVTVNYDVNRDGIIDAKDMDAIDKSFNTLQGYPNFNPAADLNNDKVINMADKMLLIAYFSRNNILT
jgi:peptidoglycan hydrolase-like protein with peptidoglycan-binding domain